MDEAAPLPPKDTSVSRFNSLRSGLRSRYTVLPWESREEYEALLSELLTHHAPVGPTEAHLVAEMAGVMWRLQRIQQAEAALYRKELAKGANSPFGASDVIEAALVGKHGRLAGAGLIPLASVVAPPEESEAEDAEALLPVTEVAAKLRADDDYAAALAALPPAYREQWETEYLGETLEEGEIEYTYEATAGDLLHYLERHLLPAIGRAALTHTYRAEIAEQLHGQAFAPVKLEVIARYEIHLDRKLERMLAMLIKLQQLRQTVTP